MITSAINGQWYHVDDFTMTLSWYMVDQNHMLVCVVNHPNITPNITVLKNYEDWGFFVKHNFLYNKNIFF